MKPRYTLVFHVLVLEDAFGEDMARFRKLMIYFELLLDFLTDNPDVAFSFELSATEALILRDKYPALFAKMKQLVERRQIGLVEGSFAQPHFHTIGRESNIRQMEYGLRTLKDLLNTRVDFYSRQESSFHHQLPQILSGFGFRYACAPSIGQTFLEFQKGILNRPGFVRIGGVYGFPGGFSAGRNKIEDLRGQQRGAWIGLDGSRFPYIMTEPMSIQDCIEREHRAEFTAEVGLAPSNFYHDHPDHCLHPTPSSVDEIAAAKPAVDFVRAEDNIAAVIESLPCTHELRLMTITGYCEGHWGELCQCANRRAEYQALQVEALVSMATLMGVDVGPGQEEELRRAWRNLLSAQHHDMWVMPVQKMNEASASWSEEALAACQRLVLETTERLGERIDTSSIAHDGRALLVVYNTLPWPRRDHAKQRLSYEKGEHRTLGVFDGAGERVLSDFWVVRSHEDGSIAEAEVLWEASVPAFGYTTYFVDDAESAPNPPEGLSIRQDDDIEIANQNMKVRVGKKTSGITSVQELSTKTIVFEASSESLVAELQAHVNPGGGAQLFRSRDGRVTMRTGRYFARVTLEGECIFGSFSQEFDIGPSLPRIDIRTRVSIDTEIDIGEFHKQDSKLRMLFPFSVAGKVYYDIPFGALELESDRKFYPTSWTATGNASAAGMVVHTGTMLHLFKEQHLSNVLLVANRKWSMDWENLLIDEDQRFKGSRLYQHSLICQPGPVSPAEAARRAMEVHQPLLVVRVLAHKGEHPLTMSVLNVESKSVLASAFVPRDGSVLLRLFESQGQPGSAQLRLSRPMRISEEGLDGAEKSKHPKADVHSIQARPWEIKNYLLAP